MRIGVWVNVYESARGYSDTIRIVLLQDDDERKIAFTYLPETNRTGIQVNKIGFFVVTDTTGS
jgi:hypothetical protein